MLAALVDPASPGPLVVALATLGSVGLLLVLVAIVLPLSREPVAPRRQTPSVGGGDHAGPRAVRRAVTGRQEQPANSPRAPRAA